MPYLLHFSRIVVLLVLFLSEKTLHRALLPTTDCDLLMRHLSYFH